LPTVFVITILSFVNSFKVFREAYLISGDYPQQKIYMLQHLFNNWFVALDIQKMSAAAVMCVLLFLLVILLFRKLNREEE
jgi:multiple sugar transport system permease protein